MKQEYNIIPAPAQNPRKANARYMKPESVKRLVKDYFSWKYQGSTIPEHCRVKPKFRDDTANGLAGCLNAWCKVNNAFFQRNNSQGQYDSRLKIWRRSGSTKGIADTQVTYRGNVYNFEIKIGRDKQSDAQKQVQYQIESAGGHYAVIKSFDEFLNEINR